MWPRVVEFMLGLWLLVSPFLFGHYREGPLWISDMVCAGLVMIVSMISYWPPLKHAHLLILAVGGYLILFAYFYGGYPSAPGFKNDIFVGLTLVLIAISPNHASDPPQHWRRYYLEKAKKESKTA